jgi:hypothetical protein
MRTSILSRAKLMSAALFATAASGQLCFADSLLPMSGPLVANTNPAVLDVGGFGSLDVRGAISGLAFVQDNPSVGDKGAEADLDNALLFVQNNDDWLQLFAALGPYSFPALGTAYLSLSRTPGRTYGDIPEAFAKAAFFDGFSIEVGKLPSLIGDESVFTIQNINVERGLLWNQTPSISRGVQLNYASGPVGLSLSWNDGFYSKRFNWIAGSASYTLDGDGGAITLIGGGNAGHTAYADFATPLAQNNSAILNLAYSIVLGAWTLNPYIQASEIRETRAMGLTGTSRTTGAAMLLVRKLNENWSIGARGEYLGSQGARNLLYGVGSTACSFTITPTYQKGVMFARVEASYVVLFHAQPGLELGRKADNESQARLMFETGVLL